MESLLKVKDFCLERRSCKLRRTGNAERFAANGNNTNNSTIDDVNNQLFSNYQVIPNPNNGNFVLKCMSNDEICCTLIDVSGREVYSNIIKPVNNQTSFNFGSVTKGIYNLKVIDNSNVIVLKIIIK